VSTPNDPRAGRVRHRLAAQPVLDELGSLGFQVHQIPELRRFGASYAPAVPALARHLAKIDHAGVREELARVLAVPWAREHALAPLLEVFARTPNSPPATKAALAAAIEALADASVESELVRLCTDRSHGSSRELLVLALGKLDSPAVADVLAELLRDRFVGGHAVQALLRITERTRLDLDSAILKPFFNDGRAWVRRAARDLAAALQAKK
jgi:hypothetical protein